MNRYAGIVIDIVFILAYFIIVPALLNAIKIVSTAHPLSDFRLNIYAFMIYPLASWAVLHKITTTPKLKEGLRVFNNFVWRWYAWPLGIILWLSIFAHSATMTVLWMVWMPGWEILTVADKIILITAIAFYFGIVFLLMRRMAGAWGLFTGWASFEFERGWWLFLQIVMMLIFLPLFLSIIFTMLFCLYFFIWIYASNAEKLKPILPDNYFTKIASSLLIFLYTIVIAYYFDMVVSRMFSGAYFLAAVAIIYFYIPLRFFFALSAGRSILGWVTFVLSIVIVYLDAVF